MRYIIFILLFLMSGKTYCQDSNRDTLNQIVNGLKHGLWKEPVEKDDYEYALIEYFKGIKEGSFKVYYGNDSVATLGFFKNDKLHGAHKSYFKNGNIKMTTTYLDGVENGTRKTYYKDGKLFTTSVYERDTLSGMYTEYYPNGQIHFQYTYMNGKIEGPYKMYREDGSVIYEGQFKNDKKVGSWIKYDANGNIVKTENYQ